MPHRITCLADLQPYGIIPLTGEADALSRRMLCDLTRNGVAIFCKTHGLPRPDELSYGDVTAVPGMSPHNILSRQELWPRLTFFADAWNSGSPDNPHVASVLLGYHEWGPLAIMALLEGVPGLPACVEVYHEQDADIYTGITQAELFDGTTNRDGTTAEPCTRDRLLAYWQAPIGRTYSGSLPYHYTELQEKLTKLSLRLLAKSEFDAELVAQLSTDTAQMLASVQADLATELSWLAEKAKWCAELANLEGRHHVRKFSYQRIAGVSQGDRNVHQMTGRVQ